MWPKTKLHAGLVETFNDKSYIAVIPAIPSLHKVFLQEQLIEKGEFTMTAARVADLLQSRKLEMKTISENFHLSGNGEDMLGQDGEVMDGGKRSGFLRGKPSDLLYWWMIYESNDLMTMTFAEFGANAVDGSTATPINKRNSASSLSVERKKARTDMASSVEKLNSQMIQCNKSSYRAQLNDLTAKRFNLKREMRKYKKEE